MKTTLTILILTVISAVASDSSEALKLRVNQVRVGMTRAEVEKIIPMRKSSPVSAIFSGGAQFETYWIDSQWKISIGYDYTGIPRDKSGKALHRQSSKNKVVSKPQLIREDMPAPLVIKTKDIEQTGARQPATAPESKAEGKKKPEPESKGRSQ